MRGSLNPPMRGSLNPLSYPGEWVTIHCNGCDRRGRYACLSLAERFGANTAMPDILNAITDCERNHGLSIDRCKAYFVELAGPSAT